MDSFVDDINAEVIGVNIDEQAQEDNRYLYELPPMRYDSVTPERDLLRHGYNDKVTVLESYLDGPFRFQNILGLNNARLYIYD